MSGTLYAQDLLNAPVGFAAAGLLGMLFGFFLEQAGFGSSRRLTGMFYFRDMAVVKVMFTAVVTALIGRQYLEAVGLLRPTDLYLLDTFWGAQIVGGLLFGVGFVMGGWCPGTAFVGVASLKWDALVFLVGAVLGSVLFNESFAALRPLYEGGHAGVLHLSGTLGVPTRLLVVGFAAAAVAMFALCTRVESWLGGQPRPAPAQRRNHRLAGVLMLALAAGTLLMPTAPAGRATGAAAQAVTAGGPAGGVPALAEVDAAADHLDPLDLADALMRNAKDWTVVDIRSTEEYAAFHLRGAVNVPLAELAANPARIPRTGTVVLYSNGTTHAAQAWLALRQRGWTNVRVLSDGVLGFWRECLTPPSLSGGGMDPTAAQAQSAAFAARRAFFLSATQTVPAAAAPAAPSAAGPVIEPLVAPGLDQHVVSVAWLAERLADPRLRLLDVRAKSTDYTRKHIPGALYLNFENLRGTVGGLPNMLVPGADIAVALGRLGIERTDTVVVYSDQLRDATLVATALERVGHPSVAVLHGGWSEWLAAKGPVTNAIPTPAPVTYAWDGRPDSFTATAADVLGAAVGEGGTVILDVRPADYFSGAKSDEPRSGHIPGARNREFTLDLVRDSAAWQSEAALRAAYTKLGIGPQTPVIVHCRTGHQASQTYWLLKHVLGNPNVRWYDGSWLDWSARPELPIQTGD